MSFFQKLKYTLGLDSDSDYENDDVIADDPVEKVQGTRPKAQEPNPEPRTPNPKAKEVSTDIIFEHVVNTFNQALPSFLRNSVDPEAQRKFLYQTLDGDIRAYIDSLEVRAAEKAREKWQNEQQRLKEDMRKLEVQTKEFDEKRTQLEQKLLSNERQRRALTDRVHDLESKILTFEAEREQFQLENKSLVNKVKVAQVFEKENEELREEINELRANGDQALVKEIDRLKGEMDEARKQGAAEAEAKFKDQLKEIEEQILQFQTVKDKKDKQIADLKDQLAQSEEKIRGYEQTVERNIEMQSRSEKNLREEIAKLQAQLANSKAQGPRLKAQEEPATTETKRRKERIDDERRRINAGTPIEDILTDTDWIVAEEPKGLKQKAQGARNKAHDKDKDNDSQLSLF